MEKEHNLARPLPDGKLSYKLTEKGYFNAKNAGCRIGISMQVGKHNYHNLLNLVDDMYEYFQPHEFGIGCNFHNLDQNVPNPYQLEAETVIPKILEVYEKYKEKGIYIEQIVRRIRPFITKKIKGKDCTACGRKIVAVPDKKIGFYNHVCESAGISSPAPCLFRYISCTHPE